MKSKMFPEMSQRLARQAYFMNSWHTLLILAMLLFPVGLRAQILVDCSGANLKAYSSINAALPNAGPGSTIIVTGTCTETVNLNGVNNLNIGAYWGQTATLIGGINIWDSKFVYLYGLNISNASWDGIGVYHSTSIYVDTCTSSANTATGLAARYGSEVTLFTSGTFDHNPGYGIYVDTGSIVQMFPWGGPVDISNNGTSGVLVDRGTYWALGNTTILNNGGWGIEMYSARASVGTAYGPNSIQGNALGGASVNEVSEASFWNIFGLHSLFQGNGAVGISVGLGSQVTLSIDGVQIFDHTSAGVDVYGNSQANLFGANSLQRNGNLSDLRSAGIRLDGNSQALIRGGDISQNYGPGILALVNSSVDFTGLTSSGNAKGAITCDSSATMVSDLAQPNSTPPAGVICKTPHALGNRSFTMKPPKTPDLAPYKALQAKYKKIATRH
jgi:hypothetical protein